MLATRNPNSLPRSSFTIARTSINDSLPFPIATTGKKGGKETSLEDPDAQGQREQATQEISITPRRSWQPTVQLKARHDDLGWSALHWLFLLCLAAPRLAAAPAREQRRTAAPVPSCARSLRAPIQSKEQPPPRASGPFLGHPPQPPLDPLGPLRTRIGAGRQKTEKSQKIWESLTQEPLIQITHQRQRT